MIIPRPSKTLTTRLTRPDTSSFGASKQGKHLVVSYTERAERIRVISARQMTSRERTAYEE
jgi:uncharacterized DUF497 family protein